MSENNVVFIPSNFEKSQKKNSHDLVLYKNYKWCWKRTNKDGTVKYYCSLRDKHGCTATIKLDGQNVVDVSGQHFHDSYSESKINVTVDRRVRLATLLDSNDENMEKEDSFNYVQSLIDYNPLRETRDRNKNEEAKLDAAVETRKQIVTPTEVRKEAEKILVSNGGTRKRINNNDLENAEKRIWKRIRIEEQERLTLEFRENNIHLLSLYTV